MVDPSHQELGPSECVHLRIPILLHLLEHFDFKIPTAYPEGKDGPTRIKVISGRRTVSIRLYGHCADVGTLIQSSIREITSFPKRFISL